MNNKIDINTLLIRDHSKEMGEIASFVKKNGLKIRKIVAERFMMISIFYKKNDGFWDIHYYNYIRHRGIAIQYIYLSLISILRREKIWFKTINPIELDEINKRILIDHFTNQIEINDAIEFRKSYMQGIYLGFEIYKLLSENLITPKDVIKLFYDCDLLHEHAGYYAALKRFGAFDEAKIIIDFFWKQKRPEFIKTVERIDECLESNKIEIQDFFYIQKVHFPLLKTIDFDKKYHAFMKDKKNQLEFDLAISFAGENRDIAKNISDSLKKRGYNIFYDEYEKSKMWGKDLYEYLSEIYSTKAKYCLILISEAYTKKPWTRLEKKSAQSRAFEDENEYILPLRIDDSKVPGILSTTGYIDYRNESMEEVVNLLIEKINNYGD
ncbi:MAG: TIR domain-containing protein [Flavobacteriaceae bacterium]|nr:TIR domain-containing protein [Flavobacteriaceae bacterium]